MGFGSIGFSFMFCASFRMAWDFGVCFWRFGVSRFSGCLGFRFWGFRLRGFMGFRFRV